VTYFDDDPSITGYGDGWAEPCPVCRDPLDEDGSCFYCGTVPCHGCSAVIKHEDAVLVDDGGTKKIPLCRPCADAAPEEIEEAPSRAAATVKLKSDPTIKESGAQWADKLSQEVG